MLDSCIMFGFFFKHKQPTSYNPGYTTTPGKQTRANASTHLFEM